MKANAVLADKASDAWQRVILPLTQRGIEAVIPSKNNRLQPRPSEKAWYQARHLIENFLAKLKPFWGIATHYDKRSSNFLGAIHLAAGLILLA